MKEWWHNLRKEQIPKYLKIQSLVVPELNGRVIKIISYGKWGRDSIYVGGDVGGDIGKIHVSQTVPATESEYNEQLKTQKITK